MWQRLVLLVAFVGCGSSKSPGSIDGTIGGNAYPVAATISATLTSPGTGAPAAAVIVLSSSDDVCQPADAPVQHPGQKTIVILLVDGNGAPAAPGTFTVVDAASSDPPPAKAAILYTSILDATCGNNAQDQTSAVSGTVTLTLVGDGVYDGHFDVMLDSGDHVTGSFNPSLCEDLPDAFKSQSTPTCKP